MRNITNRKAGFAVLLSFVFMLLIVGALQAQEQTSPPELPDTIQIESPGLFPEGIEYDAVQDRFLIGSMAEGGIFAVTGSGAPQAFITDPDVASSVGIQVDADRNRLLVVSSDTRVFIDPTLPGRAELAAYDLESGDRLFLVNLADLTDDPTHVANDVTVDAEGNAYVTDTFAPLIYKVDVDGQASVLVRDEAFNGQGGPGLNGIEYHPGGYLLAGSIPGKLFKVTLDAEPTVTEVALEQPVVGADGLILDDYGRLIVVSGQLATVFALHSDDDWNSAVVDATFGTDPEGVATTATIRDGEVYVLYAHLNVFGTPDVPETFQIVHVTFEQ